MHHAFIKAVAQCSKVLIIGSDCPYITKDIIEDAFDQLNNHDVVVGPTFDGGYYLLGMKQFHLDLFQDIPWSSEKVFSMTLGKIKKLGLAHWIGPKLNDIDYAEDWNEYLASTTNPPLDQ